MANIQRILCPIDFSDPSRAAADHAFGLASQLGAAVTLIHAYQVPVVAVMDAALVPSAEWVTAIADAARARLAEWAKEYAPRSKEPVDTVLAHGAPHVEIVAAAESRACDLIVMGTHGRTGLSHIFLGSVAERVVRTSNIPVLTVRAPSAAEKDDA